MIIRRVQVEGGFLNNLDLQLADGLNVLIGGRGTGKTSIIELIRYCLDLSGYADEESNRRSREHALSVLDDGQVTLTLEENKNTYLVSRTAGGEVQGWEAGFAKPLIFSQKDVEAVGLSAKGRLNIVDSFLQNRRRRAADEGNLVGQIKSLTVEIRVLASEIDGISEKVTALSAKSEELKEAEVKSREISKTSKQIESKQKQLDALSSQSSALSVRADTLRRALQTIASYESSLLGEYVFGLALDAWPTEAGSPDLLQPARAHLEKAEKLFEEAHKWIAEAKIEVEKSLQDTERAKLPLDEQARAARREIEAIKEGAGAVARQLSSLREQVSQLEALRKLRSERQHRLETIQGRRGKLLDDLEALRTERFSERSKAAQKLTEDLAPFVRVTVDQAAQTHNFSSAIAGALRGSGLKYNELSTTLASLVTPRELVEAAENEDSVLIAEVAGISEDRSARVVSQIREDGGEEIIAALLEDEVTFELLDGDDFKSIQDLSTGQRCTVILSLILEHPERCLVVDQPEDHLDNAYVAGTLIKAIRNRKSRGQLLFSTHNANIPVLGEASLVARLGSDGKHGFVLHSEPLDHPKSIAAIKSVMEGGEKAFETRAKFYRRYSNE